MQLVKDKNVFRGIPHNFVTNSLNMRCKIAPKPNSYGFQVVYGHLQAKPIVDQAIKSSLIVIPSQLRMMQLKILVNTLITNRAYP